MNIKDLKQIKVLLTMHTMSNVRQDVIARLTKEIDIEINSIMNEMEVEIKTIGIKGTISNVNIYNKALDKTEILNKYIEKEGDK